MTRVFFRLPFILLLIFGLGAAFLYALPAAAQGKALGARTPYSEAEKAGFAFYRLAGRTPPFEQWIVNREKYLLAKPSARREYLQEEMSRLTRAFNEYSMQDNLIVLRTRVTLKTPSKAEQEVYKNMGVRKPVTMVLSETRDNIFPIEVGQMWIGLVPNHIEDYLELSLNDEEFTRLMKQLGFGSGGEERQAIMEIRLRPEAIDTAEPIAMDNIHVWLMLSDIASISLWNTANTQTMAWERHAPWYLPQGQKDLMDLYGGP